MCDKVVFERLRVTKLQKCERLCVKDCVCDDVVCERFCVTKLYVRDFV